MNPCFEATLLVHCFFRCVRIYLFSHGYIYSYVSNACVYSPACSVGCTHVYDIWSMVYVKMEPMCM